MNFGIMRKRLGAIIGVGAAIVVAAPGMALAQAGNMGAAELLPPNAKPGECYARVFVPPTYKTETAQVITREASERVEIIPARYEKVTEQVLVREAVEKNRGRSRHLRVGRGKNPGETRVRTYC